MQVAFGRVRRKTAPTGPGTTTVIALKLTLMVRLGNRTYRAREVKIGEKNRELNNPDLNYAWLWDLRHVYILMEFASYL